MVFRSMRSPVVSLVPTPTKFRVSQFPATTLLADGRVLLTGGFSQSGEALDSVELWDPDAAAFVETTPLPRPAANHTTVLLPDGRLLVVLDGSGPDGVVEPFLYEPEVIR